MAKRVRILVSALMVTALLIVGTSVVVMAQEDETEAAAGNGFMARVAQILGIDETALTDAFEQARQEIGQELKARWQERLKVGQDNAEENGTLTRTRAGEIRQWQAQKPEVTASRIRQARKAQLSVGTRRGNCPEAAEDSE